MADQAVDGRCLEDITLLRDEYLDHCRMRNLSGPTIVAKSDRLRYFLLWLEQERVTELTQRVVNSYVRYLIHKYPSPFTAKGQAGTLCAFLNWASSEEVEPEGRIPHFRVSTIKTPRLIKDILSRDQIKVLETTAGIIPDRPTRLKRQQKRLEQQAERNRLVVRILADTGMRVSELVTLTGDDVKSRNGKYFLRVYGKGRKQRDIPITPSLVRRIRSISNGDSPLFIGTRTPYGPLEVHGVQQMLRILGEKAIGRRINPHLFRHTYITQMLANGMDCIALAHVVGHEDIAMIMRVYNHLKAQDTHDAVMRALSA